MTGDCIRTVAGIDGAAYFKGCQDRRDKSHPLLHELSGPDRIPGNLFPAREIYFPGINNPTMLVVSLQVERHRQHLFNYIVFLRITPFLPNWFINMVSPVINVPLSTFFIGTFFGQSLHRLQSCLAYQLSPTQCTVAPIPYNRCHRHLFI